MSHKLESRSRRLVRMVPVVWLIVTAESVKVAVHPASQSLPMESKEVLPSAGKRCAMQAAGGSCGRLMSAMWLVAMVVPLGSCTERGSFVARTLRRPVASMARKWPVQPVSAMREVGTMLLLSVMVEAEGPSGGDAVVEILFAIEILVSKTVVGVVTGCLPVWLGSPRPQAARGVASTGA